jgi:hypothetical protein
MDINCKNFTRMLRRPSEPAALTGHLFQLGKARSLTVVFPMPMAVASAKEPPIAGRTAIRILEHHEVPEPVLDATSSRPEALFAAAIRTARGLSARGGLLHGKSFGAGFMLQRLAALVEVEAAVSGLQSFQIAKMGETFAG